MKRISITLIGLLVAAVALAQQAETVQTEPFTLEQCIQFALDNSIAAKNADLDQRIAKAKINETIGIGLPQISGSASVVHNQKLPRFFTPYNPEGGFLDLSGIPGIQPGDVVAAKSPFQLPSSGNASLAINQIIFNGSYIVGLQASSVYKDLSVKTAEQTDQNIIQQVAKAYYAVLINK